MASLSSATANTTKISAGGPQAMEPVAMREAQSNSEEFIDPSAV